MKKSTKPRRKVRSGSKTSLKVNSEDTTNEGESTAEYHLVMTVAGEFFVGYFPTMEKVAEVVVEKLKTHYLSPARVLVFHGDRVQCSSGGNALFPVVEFKHGDNVVSTTQVLQDTLQEMPEGVLFGTSESEQKMPDQEDEQSTDDLFGF